ncbi:MAG TPA: hypothetical protein VD978_05020 [Azospirillum sp.]|nr:hypothetical protein [Azospirillum sp.]
MQQIAWVTTLILMSSIAAVFVWVAWSTRFTADYGPIVDKAYAFRRVLFGALLTVSAVATAGTIGRLPYAHAANDAGVQVVTAIGYQWHWDLGATEVKAGRPVEFRVTAADVTHGFAIYDADLKLVTQTQAMPGYTNILQHTFDRPGIYKILCLEYCGLAHHGMSAELTVSG